MPHEACNDSTRGGATSGCCKSVSAQICTKHTDIAGQAEFATASDTCTVSIDDPQYSVPPKTVSSKGCDAVVEVGLDVSGN